jgi:RNA polymerase sigma-70 factor (ECF subfamily)
MCAELGAVLHASVRGLPQAYRSVVVARLIHDMSTLETCEWLQLSEEAVKTRLHRAKAMLRRELHGRVRQLKPHMDANKRK